PPTATFVEGYLNPFKAAAASLGAEAIVAPVNDMPDIESLVTAEARKPSSGLVVIPDAFTGRHRARMHVDSKIIVKVNRPAQHRCRLRHEAAGRHRLRDGNHRSLLYKCTHRHQHHGTGDPSQARVEAQSHRDLLRDLDGANKTPGHVPREAV